MNIVYFANGSFALNPLKKLLQTNHNIVAVVTNIDKPSGRNKILKSTPIASFAKKNNIDLLKISNLNNKEFIQKLTSFNSDVFVVISYKILPEIIFKIPKYGSINIHASYLPEYPGASPIQRSIINGEKYLGLTSFLLNNKIDRGDIIYQIKISINDTINYGEAHDLLSEKSSNLLLKTIDKIQNITPIKQKGDIKEYAHKINKNEYKVSLNNNSNNVHNLFRGLTPPGPYLLLNNKRIKLFNTFYLNNDNKNYKMGQFYIDNDTIYIKCKDGFITATSLQFEGKNIIAIKDFKNMNLINNIKFE